MLKYHIQTVELTSAQASIGFTDIPQNFTDLYVLCSLRSTAASGASPATIRFNGSSSNFTSRRLLGSGQSVTSSTFTNGSFSGYQTDTSNTFESTTCYIPNYAGSTNKSFSSDHVTEANQTVAYQALFAGLWANTAAITSLSIHPDPSHNFAIGTSVSLYGVRRGDSKETASATGGTVTTSGGYTIHTFNTSGTFTVSRPLEVEYLVIGGGGSGGCGAGGGGGAGGYRSSVVGQSSGGGASAESRLSLTSGTNYTVTVGAGGASRSGGDANGFQGSSSAFGSITSTGGGYGAGWSGPGGSGGSGGGASYNATGGTGTANQGFAGGGAASNAGGGGGAGEAGNTDTLGFGGDGVSSNITGSSVMRGGGGAGATGSAQPGDGGGGTSTVVSGSNVLGGNGTANTGGGGGGSNGGLSTGAGGSGVVIIRYLTP